MPLVACGTWVPALVYCNFLKQVRLGGWGTEGPKAPTLGQYVRVRAPPFPYVGGGMLIASSISKGLEIDCMQNT